MGTDPPPWVRDAIVYQIFPDRFASSTRVHKPGRLEAWDAPPTRHGFKGGDLIGIIEHLDHLSGLGVNTISLNPIFASAANHRYHTYDYRAVDPLLGGDAALRELLDAAHRRGMRVILDGVFNHASRGFWPFHHVMENGSASPYVDWFILNPEFLAAGRQLRAYDEPSIPEVLETEWAEAHAAGTESLTTLGYRAWWDLPALPKLNTDNPEVRAYLFGAIEHWTRFGADGWRLDVAAEIETPGFWEEFRARVKSTNPEAYIVAENWEERPALLDGRTFDALMNYPFLCATVGFATGAHLDARVVAQHAWLARRIVPLDGAAFAERLSHLAELHRAEARDVMLNLVDSHDTPRLRSMAGGDPAAMRLALLVQMTFPGAPCVYYGDEIGMAGEMDPASRASFSWDREAWDHDLLAYAHSVIALRSGTPALRAGELRVVGAAGPALAYLRGDGRSGLVLVALNSADERATLEVLVPELGGRALRMIPLPGADPLSDLAAGPDGALRLVIPARSGVVMEPAP
jgi:cyclomaltodextrinase / maltogenic alpha-amylase / neopullulanase